MGLTYSESGVDIEKEAEGIKKLVSTLGFQRKGFGAPLELKGHFTGLLDFGDFALSLCTDGVGSKLMIAEQMKKWDTVGIDCIAMNVNDMICAGAEPLAFVDYIATEKIEPNVLAEIGKGLAKGAEESNMTIIGGETASLPDIVNGLDLAGTCLGYVKKDRIVTGERVQPGDALVGLASSGIHSNGYSLVRRIIEESGIRYTDPFPGATQSFGDVLLEPTMIYVKPVLECLKKFDVHGLGHITGGGLLNIPRMKTGVGYSITDPLPVPKVFQVLQDMGGVEDKEMYRTFNMGMGFIMVVPEDQAGGVVRLLDTVDYKSQVVGAVEQGSGVSHKKRDLYFDTE